MKVKLTNFGKEAKKSWEDAKMDPPTKRAAPSDFRLRQTEASSSRVDNADARMYAMAEGEGRAPGTITCGPSANRPNETYMKTYGVNNAIYFATDTFTLSAWTGTAWKSVTLA